METIENMSYFSQVASRDARILFAAFGVFLIIAGPLVLPTKAQAITQLDCPAGTIMKWEDRGTSIFGITPFSIYDHFCVDSTGIPTSAPIQTETAATSCSPGYTEVLQGGLSRTTVCVPESNSEYGGTPVQCATTWNKLINPGICLTRSLFAAIASFFIWIGVKFVTMAGGLFEAVLKYTIVDFGGTLVHMKSGIDAGWTALRDIANIVIIGMFTFIAISLILGIKEYGERKMIAKVLLVAVLINFSLLFTKIIIDASNFTARQFYQSMVRGIDSGESVRVSVGSGDTGGSETINGTGVAAVFMNFLGVAGFTDAYGTLQQTQENTQYAVSALGYGLLSFVFLVATGIVFLYGSFLIVTRAILLIFLMLTSALAFASYLIPKFAGGNYGWQTWWNSLLRASVLAPLLMIFLWMTAIVSGALTASMVSISGGKVGTLGALATNASDPANITALFSFVLVLGLLFASFKAASAFSNTIAGFATTTSALKLSAGLPLAFGGRLAGFAGRNLVGRGAAKYGRGVEDDIKKTRGVLSRVPLGSHYDNQREALRDRLRTLEATKKTAGWVAGRGFSLAGTGVGKEVLKNLGVPSLVAGGKVEGFGDRAKRVSEEAAKRAVEVTTLSDSQKDAARRSGEQQATAIHRQEKTRMENVRETARIEKDVAETRLSTEKAAREGTIKEAERKKRVIEKEIEGLARDKAYAPEDSQVHRDYEAAQKRFDEQNERIERARSSIATLEQDATAKKQAHEAAEAAVKKHDDGLGTNMKEAGEKALAEATGNLEEAAKTLATQIASGRGTRIFSLGMDPDNSHISRLARDKVVPRIKSSAYRKRRQEERELDKELGIDGGGTTGTSAPPSGGGSH